MWRQHTELAWLGLGLGVFSLSLLVQLMWRDAPLLLWVLLPAMGYVVGMALQCKALALRWGVAYPLRWALVVGGLTLVAQAWFTLADPQLRMRIQTLNLCIYLMAGLPLLQWRRMRIRTRFDHLLRWALLATMAMWLVCGYVLLPMSLHSLQHPHAFTQTVYWLGAHMAAMLSAMMLAGTMFFACLHDVVYRLDSERQLDPLTQILNRRGFHEQLQQQAQRAPARRWAVLLCDVDHFKHVNDTLGHEAGDQVLQNIARIVRQQLRASDLLARFGGEEFVVLLADTDGPAAVQVAERIRLQVAQHARLPALRAPITISVGVAATAYGSVAAVESALRSADMQMYRAKAAGRNQVALAPAGMAAD